MIRTSITCEICSFEKNLVNHWFIMWINDSGFHFCEWDSALATSEGMKHVCGFECLTKMAGRYIERRGIKKPESVANMEPLQ